MAPKKLVKQALPIRYTNKRLLIETLVKLFGEGNFELDVSSCHKCLEGARDALQYYYSIFHTSLTVGHILVDRSG